MLLDQNMSIQKNCNRDLQIISISRGTNKEFFITVLPEPGEDSLAVFKKAAKAIRQLGAKIICQDVFGLPNRDGYDTRNMREAFGAIDWPVTWVDGQANPQYFGTLFWAVSGVELQPIVMDNRVIGHVFEMENTRFCRMGDLRPAAPSGSNESQAEATFEMMDKALRRAGMDFSNVVRTWFFNHDILAWYDEFNTVRTTFFQNHQIFDGLVPASTGIGGSNPAGTALISGLLAIDTDSSELKIQAVPSPLQCPALDYGSSFSRAVELETTAHRRLFISGTASIDLDGTTIHLNDMEKQIQWTMDVVAAILDSRKMNWNDVVRGIVYIRNQQDLSLYKKWEETAKLPNMPIVVTQNVICRDDLLFEIELDAITTFS